MDSNHFSPYGIADPIEREDYLQQFSKAVSEGMKEYWRKRKASGFVWKCEKCGKQAYTNLDAVHSCKMI